MSTATQDDLSRGVRQLEVLGAKLAGGTPATYTDPPSPLLLLVLTGLLAGILAVFFAFAEYNEIRANWPEYRCSPSVMPFSKFYGYDLNENINFCMQQAVKEHAPGVVEPIYKAIGGVATVIDGVFTKAEAVEGGVSSLLAGFETFVSNFLNSMRLVGTRMRMSVVRIRDIFTRIHGVFIAFAYAGISALTFGENLACNPLVSFMGTVAGVDVCCFVPDTWVLRESGRPARIDSLHIGDRLAGGIRVCSTYRFNGRHTPMRQIGGVRLSAGHYVKSSITGQMIPAGEHPLAIPILPEPELICLATDTHRIPIYDPTDGMVLDCADYEESSDVEVCAAAQRAAEEALNGPGNAETPMSDYCLGLDGVALQIQIKGCKWIPLSDVRIGMELATGGIVAGVIQEECLLLTEVEPGVVISAAQLLLSGETGRWRRAGRMWPRRTEMATTPRILTHLLIAGGDHSFLVRTPEGRRFLVRDYCEVEDNCVQTPFDMAMRRV